MGSQGLSNWRAFQDDGGEGGILPLVQQEIPVMMVKPTFVFAMELKSCNRFPFVRGKSEASENVEKP